MNKKYTILIIAHAHPDFQLGGGEIAAYNLFKSYQKLEVVQSTYFLGRKNTCGYPSGKLLLRNTNNYAWEQSSVGFNMRSENIDCLAKAFRDFIFTINPNIIHFHHFFNIGIDTIYAIKKYTPNAKIIFTLHEYLAICANNGQMLKKDSNKLCFHSSPEECKLCIKDISLADVWLREYSFHQLFKIVDMFVSPSHFLRQRYIEWGIPAEKIVVIENGQPNMEKLPPRHLDKGERRNRFAFFGQLTPFKGVDVLLEALQSLPKKMRKQIVLEIHGANLEMQPPEYQEKIIKLCKSLSKEGILQWVGHYHPSELRKRMSNIDWVVVPSIWWENSPMVIQEAFMHGRPLLVSDIGGMAEKVRDGIDGFHVQVANRLSWGDTLVKVANFIEEWDNLYANLPRPISYKECAEEHIKQLRKL